MDKSTSDILKRILKASEQGNLTFFIGAGVSCLSQYPSWSELLDRILDKLKKRKETNASNISIENNLKIGKKTTYPKVTFDSEDSLFKDSANSANKIFLYVFIVHVNFKIELFLRDKNNKLKIIYMLHFFFLKFKGGLCVILVDL